MLINGKFRCAGCMKELHDEFVICNCGYNNDTDSNDSHCLRVGTVLDNTYVVGKVIGEGGFGITYVGWDKDLDVKVAIKEFFMNGFSSRYSKETSEISANTGEGEELFEINREKFINEAKVLATFMNEPGIVSIYKFFRENNTAYIVMEYVEGITLKTYLQQKGKLSVEETIGLMGPVMNSLAKVHEKNLVHRDISPDNIMITADGRGKLIDFGAAREANGGNKSLSVVLKHGFAPVEQYQSKGNQGPWTDVYALSATIYKCITGAIPPESVDRVFDDSYVSMYVHEPECSIAISDVIDKGLGIKVEDRYQSVGELKNALIGALNSNAKEPVDNSNKKESIVQKNEASVDGKKTGSVGTYSGKKLKSSKKRRGLLIATAIIVIAAGLGALAFIATVLPAKNYDKAVALMKEENYDAAIAAFKKLGDYKDSEANIASINEKIAEKERIDAIKNTNIGDIIVMGQYEQDNNIDNGKEDVEWQVLAKEDNKLLLISKYGLDAKPFNAKHTRVGWENCTLRKWLNEEFVNDIFSEDEKKSICVGCTVKADPNDFVFLLSYTECIKYFETNADRKCQPTAYAINNGALIPSNECDVWWLRTLGYGRYNDLRVHCVIQDGSVFKYWNYVDDPSVCVRPAFWLDLSKF